MTRGLPMRRIPAIARPSSACRGGSNVLSALMPGASVDSISAPRSAASRRRAVISTSGSSGISGPVREFGVESGVAIAVPAKDAGREQCWRHGPDRGRTQGRRASVGSASSLRMGPRPKGRLRAMGDRLAIVGGDAAGMSAATNARRRDEALEIVAFERGPYTSYSACGIPFYVGDFVHDLDALVVRSPEQHRENGIDVRTGQDVVGVDLAARELTVRDVE